MKMITYGEYIGIRKEAVEHFLSVLSKHFPQETKKNHEKSVMTIVVGFEVLTVVVMKRSNENQPTYWRNM
jgi:hypothetical protein